MVKAKTHFEDNYVHVSDLNPAEQIGYIRESWDILAESFNDHSKHWDLGQRMRVFYTDDVLNLKLKDINNGIFEIMTMSLDIHSGVFGLRVEPAIEDPRIIQKQYTFPANQKGTIELRRQYLDILASLTGNLDGNFQYDLHPIDEGLEQRRLEAERKKSVKTASAPVPQ